MARLGAVVAVARVFPGADHGLSQCGWGTPEALAFFAEHLGAPSSPRVRP